MRINTTLSSNNCYICILQNLSATNDPETFSLLKTSGRFYYNNINTKCNRLNYVRLRQMQRPSQSYNIIRPEKL